MGFFNNFSFDSLLGRKKEEPEFPQAPPPPLPPAEPVFVESEEMIDIKNHIQELTNELKSEEERVKYLKFEISKNKRKYQSHCTHTVLVENNNKETSSVFNDYQFRCEHCGAEIFNHQRTVTYLTTVIDQLSKASKMLESLTIAGIFVNSADDVYTMINKLIADLDCARGYALGIPSNKYDEHLKSRVVSKRKREIKTMAKKKIKDMTDEEIYKYFDSEDLYKGLTPDARLRLKELVTNRLFPKAVRGRIGMLEIDMKEDK